jgi:hypothetical protein
MVKEKKCFPMSDMESLLSNKATDVNEVPTSYNTRVNYRNHTPGRLLSRIIDCNHFAACGNWLLSISIDQISFCRLLSIIKHNIFCCCGVARDCHGGLLYDGRVSGDKQLLYVLSKLLTVSSLWIDDPLAVAVVRLPKFCSHGVDEELSWMVSKKIFVKIRSCPILS